MTEFNYLHNFMLNMKNIKKLSLLFAVALLSSLTGCKRSSLSGNTSRGTGWQINAKDGGFQYNTRYKGQETAPGLVFVEGGTFTRGNVQDDVMHDWNNSPNQQHVASFYMDETEVTNLMYSEYLDWIKRVYPPSDEKFKEIYASAVPDTLVWRNRLGNSEVYVENYLRHPAFMNYPVVGVSWIQAVQYAEWRTDRVNERILEREAYVQKDVRYNDINANSTFTTAAYLKRPETVYGGKMDSLAGKSANSKLSDTIKVYAGVEKGIMLPSYRLPTETEWEYAALALVGDREYNTYRGKKKYPWSGEYTRSEDRRTEGDQLANFKLGKGDYGGISGWSDDGADITIQVKQYPPNDFGIYDMAGNVAEWVSDVYRPIVDDEVSDFNYYRGNVYLKDVINEDGRAQVISPDQMAEEVVAKEREIYAAQAQESGKPAEIVEKMIDGRIRKFLSENSLTEQAFVKDPDTTVGKLVSAAGAEIIGFSRFEVGEGIEVEKVDFAAEVAAQLGN